MSRTITVRVQQGKGKIRKSGKLKKLFELMWRKEKEKKEE